MNSTARPRTWVVLCLLGLLVAAASAQEKYTLKPNFKPGQVWTFDMDQAIDVNIKISAQGQLMAQVGQEMRARRVGKAEVLDAHEGNAIAVRIAYTDKCKSSVKAGEQSQEVPFALAGKTVTVRRGLDGKLAQDSGLTLDEATMEELKQFLDPDLSFYPKEAIAVGQEWKGDSKQLAKVFQLQGKDDTADLTGNLVSVKDVDGRKTAELKLSANLASTLPEGFRMKITLGGTMLVDVATGQIVQGNVKGPIGVSGDMRQTAPDGTPVILTANGDGNANFTLGNKIEKAGAAGEKPAVVNPLGEQPKPAAGVAGIYASAQLSIELVAKGNDDYAGTITMGDKKFPFTAHHDAVKGLTGNFEAGGAKFAFSASIDGTGMTFNTEGTKYELKKEAPKAVNPLLK